ncbi:MAG: wax ester/triacylglycerol synthase family O-acyltransferase [Haliea sp.]|nr:wax ester/triacylglycerol synthase family O-acyltransferase [Haliea sp.]
MQQLTEMDYTFVQMESNRTPMHISPVMVYDQSRLKGGKVRFKEILRVFERNLHKSSVFRRKLAGGAMGLDTPYWIEDEHFDLEFHVRHIALPKPGDWRQLCILLARLQARGLDMRRPLWEAYVIEGLNDVEGLPPNSFAIMMKVHHAAIDGVSAAEIITAIHSLTDEREPPATEDPWRPESDPSPLTVWSRAYINNIKRPVKLLETVGEMVPRAIRASRASAQREGDDKPPLSKTRFNGRVSSYRVTDAIALDLDRVKQIKNAVPGSTVNDVIVSVVGGGLRKYLQSKNDLPEGSLTCGAPINVRPERNSDSIGNQVGFMTIDMATDVDDALARLQAVSDHARESKAYSSALGATAMMDISKGLWPQVTGAALRIATLAAVTSDVPLPVHTVVSNVPGPQVPLYLAGARMHMIMGIGPVMDMMGLFHAVISGAGKITINFVSCRELLPDPGFYRECLQQAYDELESATLGKQTATRKRRPRKARRA